MSILLFKESKSGYFIYGHFMGTNTKPEFLSFLSETNNSMQIGLFKVGKDWLAPCPRLDRDQRASQFYRKEEKMIVKVLASIALSGLLVWALNKTSNDIGKKNSKLFSLRNEVMFLLFAIGFYLI